MESIVRLIQSNMPQPVEYLYESAVKTIPDAEISTIPVSRRITGILIITAIWLTGAVCIISSHIYKHYRFRKTIGRWSDEIKDYGKVKVVSSPIINSPMMTGIIRPIIVLPDKNYTEDELAFIIRHELLHYQRKDLWYKSALVIAKSLHWFNPIIYFISHNVAVLCELSCDEAVMKNADTCERKLYSQTILSSAVFQAGIATEFVTYFTGGRKLMINRIQAITNVTKKKTNLIIVLLAFLLTLNAGAVSATATIMDKTDTNYLEWNLPPSNISDKHPGVPLITPSTKAEKAYYAQFDIVYDTYKNGYCYKGKLVGLFIDRCRNGQGIIFLNKNGEMNIKIGRDSRGKLTEVKTLSDDVDYEIDVYEQELKEYWAENGFDEWNLPGNNVSSKYSGVPLITPSTQTEKDYYAGFGITYDPDKNGYCYKGNLVGLFIDKRRNGQGVIFLSEKGEVNIKIKRGMLSGRLVEVETLSNDVDHEIGVHFGELHTTDSLTTLFLIK